MADKGSLRLTVEAPACFVGEFRFTVLRRQYGQGSLFAVVEGGTGMRLHDAMAAAELAAGRFADAELAKNDRGWLSALGSRCLELAVRNTCPNPHPSRTLLKRAIMLPDDETSYEQRIAEVSVDAFRKKLGPFVGAAETTRMPMVFTSAKAASWPIIFVNQTFLDLVGYDERRGSKPGYTWSVVKPG